MACIPASTALEMSENDQMGRFQCCNGIFDCGGRTVIIAIGFVRWRKIGNVTMDEELTLVRIED